MQNNELYHYGVPGMRWGVRRAQRKLADLTGRHHSKVSEEEAKRFRADVKSAKSIKNDQAREQMVRNANSKSASGKKYADAVLAQAKHERSTAFPKKVAITAGTVAAYPLLGAVVMQVGKGVAPVIKPVAKTAGKAVQKTVLWWTNPNLYKDYK